MSSVQSSDPSSQHVGDQVPLLTDHGMLQRVARGLSQQRSSLSSAFRHAFSWRRRSTADSMDVAGHAEHAEDIETGAGQAQPDTERLRSQDGACSLQNVTVHQCDDAGYPGCAQGSGQAAQAPAGQPCSPGSKAGTPQSADSTTAKRLFNHLLNNSGRLHRSPSGSAPVCLICLETLSADDFGSGEAMALECNCRGDVAMRHRSCAIKWARVKGDTICDICKAPVQNLPALTPRAPTEAGDSDAGTVVFDDLEERNYPQGIHGSMMAEHVPGNADLVFDCIRVTWVAMIICILFFEMNLASALWTGLIVGVAYTLFVRAMYSSQLAILQREQMRQAAALAAAQESPPAPHAPVGMV